MKKRRFFCILTALCLLLGLLCVPISAASTFFFVAVDDAIPLTLTAPPHEAATGLYVPYTVFDAAPGGVVPAYNAAEQTLVLFTRTKRLIFKLDSDTLTDENDKSSTVLTTYRNGLLYIPLATSAAHFGLSYSLLTSADGYPVLRFKTGSEVYDDDVFLDRAETLISYRVSQYDQPDATDPQPGTDNPEPDEPEVTHDPVSVYPAITDVSVMADASTVLERNGLRAAFFLTADEIRQNPDLVRQLYTAGHRIGLTASPDAADVSAALEDANDALYDVLFCKTLMALVTPQQAEHLAGYRVFTIPDTRPTVDELQAAEASVLIVCGEDAVRTITLLNQAGVSLQLLRETTQLAEIAAPETAQ